MELTYKTKNNIVMMKEKHLKKFQTQLRKKLTR